MDFYDRGGNANAYLDEKMRDTAAEAAYMQGPRRRASRWTRR